MPSIHTTVLSITALVALVQYCPAPFVAAVPEIIEGISTVTDIVDTVGTVVGDVQTFEDSKRAVDGIQPVEARGLSRQGTGSRHGGFFADITNDINNNINSVLHAVATTVSDSETATATPTPAVEPNDRRQVNDQQVGARRVPARRSRVTRMAATGKKGGSQAHREVWRQCHKQVANATVTFSSKSATEVLAEGLPPACMTLSNIIATKFNESQPIRQSESSVLFTGLRKEDIQGIQNAIEKKHGGKGN